MRQSILYPQQTKYGYIMQTQIDRSETWQTNKLVNKLIPVGFGKVQSIKEKVEIILGSITMYKIQRHGKQERVQKIVHPLFKYVFKKFIYYQYLHFKKKSDFTRAITEQVITSSKQSDSFTKDEIKDMIAQTERKINQLNIFKNSKIQKLQAIEGLLKVQLKEQIKRFNQIISQRRPAIFAIRGNQNVQYQDKNLSYIVKNLDNIQAIRQAQMYYRITSFTNTHLKYWKTSGVKEKYLDNNNLFKIKINRPTNESLCILQNLNDFVDMRNQKSDYTAQSQILIKDLFYVLREFTGKHYSKNKNYFKCLSPTSVYFDQLKLIPVLSYIPLLQESLGLKKRPMSIQNRIAFFPTPKTYDNFKSLLELYPKINLILNDPFYGCIQMHGGNNQSRLTQGQKQQIQKEKWQLQQIQQIITVQRFLLLSYYLKQSAFYVKKDSWLTERENDYKMRKKLEQQFYDPNFFQNNPDLAPALQNNQQKKLINQKKQINIDKKDPGLLVKGIHRASFFLNIKNDKIQNNEFHFLLQDLNDFISAQIHDSTIQNNKYHRIRKYFSLRNQIIMEIIRILVSDGIFIKILNVKKFIVMFLLLVLEFFEQVKKLNNSQILKQGQRKNIKDYLIQTLRRKSQKNSFSLINTTLDKIKDYRNRKKEDAQWKYMNEDQNGKKCWDFVSKYKDIVDTLDSLGKKMAGIDIQESQKNKKQYYQCMKEMDTIVQENQANLKIFLTELMNYELKRFKDMHKVLQDKKKFESYYKYYTKKLQLMIYAYLAFVQDKHVIYESLIIPLFDIQENQSQKIQIPKNNTVNEEGFKKMQLKLDNFGYIEQLIDYINLIPKKQIYFIPNRQGQEVEIYYQNNKYTTKGILSQQKQQ